ncbi:DUF4160 domain-containing protein [Roseisolibacter sp. H3M3-2]|uniref:DUF4160 domain-containing protein n=1 Tax=Roseisolibacter sp. H3M3-2 TaxID=3031323 RepID=UPI0023DBF1D0|nr:DUF4160 domain-containing protein [Roseisolibacter sp. H3M3-2]MDF1502301.1 DUF4160 domain-containing protein [Roseisolibacter sp. H3M3-2]
MPTIVKEDPFVVKVLGPPREHPPPHVHVHVGKTGLVKIRLALPDNPLKVWEVHGGVDNATVIQAVRLVEQHEAAIRAAWERIHGN